MIEREVETKPVMTSINGVECETAPQVVEHQTGPDHTPSGISRKEWAMTHSSPTWYDRSIEARNYETALSELVMEQKQRMMLVTLSKDSDLMKSEMAILTALEDHRRTFLESTLDLEDSDTYGIDAVVRARLDSRHTLRPGEYCAECGLYSPSEGDD